MSMRRSLAFVSILALLGSAPMALADGEEYDDAGRLVKSVDAEGNETLYRYDAEGRLVEKQHSDGTVERFEAQSEPGDG